jgi:Ssp1 endopeptidase immunity protein Rap1a
MRVLGVLGFAAVLMASPAVGNDYLESANVVLPGCKLYIAVPAVGTQPFEQGQCSGLVSGTVRLAAIMNTIFNHGDFGAPCVNFPERVTNWQFVAVVVHFIEARPARMHEDFQQLALEALRDAWPCAGAATSVKK